MSTEKNTEKNTEMLVSRRTVLKVGAAAAGTAAAQRTNRFAGGYTQDCSSGVCECHGAIIGKSCSTGDGQVAGTDGRSASVRVRARENEGACAGFGQVARAAD